MTWNSGSTEIVAQRATGEVAFEPSLTKRGSFGILQSWFGQLRKESVPHDPRGQCSGAAAQSHEAGGGDRQRLRGLPAVRHLADTDLSLAAALPELRRHRTCATTEPAAALGTVVGVRVGSLRSGLRAGLADPRPAADRRSAGAAELREVAGQCLGGGRGPPASPSADAVGATDPAGTGGEC